MLTETRNVPAALRQQKRWLLWSFRERDGRLTKVPVHVRPDGSTAPVDGTDPENWLSFDEAVELAKRAKVSGLGFALGDGFAAVDLDECRDPHSGEVEPWALAIAHKLDSYTERSPSGSGLHIIVRLGIDGINSTRRYLQTNDKKQRRVEILSSGRFVTVTGQRLEDFPEDVCERTEALQALLRELREAHGEKRPVPSKPPHREILRRARRALASVVWRAKDRRGVGKRIRKLFSVANADDRSGAAYALAAFFAENGAENPLDIACAVYISVPHRQKFEVRKDRWEDAWRCAVRALAKDGATGVVEEEQVRKDRTAENGKRLSVVRLSDVEPEAVEWLWYPYVPLGKLTILAGDPGVGKSWLALALASYVSGGRGLPGEDGAIWCYPNPGNVLYLAAEDGLGDVIRPRLDAMQANAARIYAVAGDGNFDDDDWRTELEKIMASLRPVLVVVDPMQAFIGEDVDTRQANQVRKRFTSRLAELAQKYHCAVVLVAHLRKSTGDRAIYRVSGSIDFVAAARSVLVVDTDPNDETGQRRVLAHAKSSLGRKGPSLTFTVSERGVEWEDSVAISADTLLAPRMSAGGPSKLEETKRWLREVLSEGPVPAQELMERAKAELGVGDRLLREAKAELGIESRREGGRWVWALPIGARLHDRMQRCNVATLEETHTARDFVPRLQGCTDNESATLTVAPRGPRVLVTPEKHMED